MESNVLNLGEHKVASLRYLLLGGATVTPETYLLHNQAYALWTRSWQQTFADLKSEAKIKADDFLRQDVIGALFDKDKAVGLLLHTYLDLDLDAVRDHSYLVTYPSHIVSQLREAGATKVLTMEYLTLDKSWGRAKIGVALSEVILGLGVKLLENSGFGAMVVVTRNDRQVNRILYGYGARCLEAGLTKHNVSVDLVSLDQGTTHSGQNADVNRWIEYFWVRREDHSQLKELQKNILEKRSA
ncbi:MAG: hypothetical protein ACXWQO_11300 [Bdellovibrionota bacterium]